MGVRSAKGKKEVSRNAKIMVGIKFSKGILLCKIILAQ